VLNELGYNAFIAGNLKENLNDSSYLDRIKEDKSAELIDTSVYPQNGLEITIEDFIELQNQCNADLTVFAEADHHLALFNAQVFNRRKRLRGRTAGIFLRPFHFYKKLNFLNRLRYLKNLPSTWKTDAYLFHEYLLKQFKLIDSALYIDENFVSRHSYSRWLPDVFQSYAEEILGNEDREQRVWINRINDFREKNKDRFIFLYFGTAQKRRGYDLLLKMAVEQDACFIHCGLNSLKEGFSHDVDTLKGNLAERGRLLETNQFISDPVSIEYFFRSVTHLILPYRNFWGSSGVMLQALGYGIPVLVPEEGIMGYRVKKYNLGLTYSNENGSFSGQLKKFKEQSADLFKNSITEYMKYQTSDQLRRVLVNIFRNSETRNHPIMP
jgi:glycosyltransferase involved in cell wall biosynthesis